MRKPSANHPQWALAHKRPGTELRCIRGNYYLYEVSSYYDPETKKPKKKSGKYLGKITEAEGFIPAKRRFAKCEESPQENTEIVPTTTSDISSDASVMEDKIVGVSIGRIKEYGLSKYITHCCQDLIQDLKEVFPQDWSSIIAMAYTRLSEEADIGDMWDCFNYSYLSKMIDTDCDMEENSITALMRSIGANWPQIQAFQNKCLAKGANIYIDDKGIQCDFYQEDMDSHNDVFSRFDFLFGNSKLVDVLKNEPSGTIEFYQDPHVRLGWQFVNLVALEIYYKIRQRLKQKRLWRRYSVEDALKRICRFKVVRLDNECYAADLIEGDKKMVLALGIPLEFGK